MEAVATLTRRQADAPHQALHDELRQACIDAMSGARVAALPHVEQRAGGPKAVLCPLGEIVAEAMRLHVVGAALLHVLRYSQCREVQALRNAIATAYADAQAPQLAALGGGL